MSIGSSYTHKLFSCYLSLINSDNENCEILSIENHCIFTEKYECPETSQHHLRNPTYQQQISVNSAVSAQTVIFNNSIMTSNEELLAQMNVSESLTSILTRSSNGSNNNNKQKTLSISSTEEPLHIGDVADLLHPQYAIITGNNNFLISEKSFIK